MNRYQFLDREKQPETGYMDLVNRFYDPGIGRFMQVDPLAQDASDWTPYRYGFNNPIRYSDPDGLFESEEEARKYARENSIRTGWFSKNKIEKGSDGTFAINNRSESSSTFREADLGVMTGALVTGKRSGPSSSEMYNKAADANIISLGFDFAFIGGMGYQYQAVRINKGEDRGWHFYHTTNANIGFGLSAGLEVSAVDFNYQNPEGKTLKKDVFEGHGNNFTVGLGAASASYGYSTINSTFSLNPFTKNKMYTTRGGAASIGAGGTVGGMWQGTKTRLAR